ncbi:MAG: glycoside hydrolase family 32 protein [Planctomycetota bacterium]|jgi:beta-fructofuranosidase
MDRRKFLKQTGVMAAALAIPNRKTFGAQRQSSNRREEPDNTSRVPRYTFANTLEEQQEQLKTNPLMLRFIESRKKLADDPYRPLYHFVSPESTLNDPNGLCFWQGRWHMFYQGYPPEDRRQHWGHAVSDDLIHWRDLPYAIYPNPERACYSGATLVEKDRVIAMYHGTRAGNMVAVSSDPLLLNWEKVTGKAVIPMRLADGSRPPYRVFDPCIWKKDGYYYSLSGGKKPGPGGMSVRANFLFRGKSLAKWEYLHTFTDNDIFSLVGDDGACPYFWPIGNKHILVHFSHMSGGKYLLGDYDKKRDKFAPTSAGDFNFGSYRPAGVHAPSATPDGKGGVIVIFNVNSGWENEITMKSWNQIMSLPRQLTLSTEEGFDEVNQEPTGDIESLRYDRVHMENIELQPNKEIVLKKVQGNCMEIYAEVDTKDSELIEMRVLRSAKSEEYTRILFYRDRGYRRDVMKQGIRRKFNSVISLDISHSSILAEAKLRPTETGQVLLKEDDPLRLRVFIDKSIVEVFVNEKQCVAARVYPGRKDSVGVSIQSVGREAKVLELDVWQMKSIYD